MSYNMVSIISIVITAVIALLVSHYFTLMFFEEKHSLFKIIQLIIAILTMTTFYAPIKYYLIKKIGIDEEGE